MTGGGETESSKLSAEFMKATEAAQQTLTDVAEEQWQRSQEAYTPLENMLIGYAPTDQGDRERMTGLAGAGLAQERGTLAGGITELGATGAGPGSGKAMMTAAKAGNEYGKSLAQATNKASYDTDLLEYDRLQRLVDIGRGQGEEAQLGLTSAAESGAQMSNAYDAYSLSQDNMEDMTTNQLTSAVGQATGLGLNYL